MAGYSGNFCSESHADMNLTQFEKDCIDEFDKDQAIAEIKFNSERESLEKVAYTVFQDTARSMSGIYTAQIPDTSLSLLFNTAANKTTHLYKVFVELMKNGFELGTDYGRSRQKKDFLKWAKKRRCSISREELIGYICNKTNNSASYHHRPSSGKHSGSSRQELSSPRISRDETDFNIQPFKEANFQGRRSSVAVGRGGLDDYHGCFIRERKRLNSACRTGSPSHKRAKICHMETEELE